MTRRASPPPLRLPDLIAAGLASRRWSQADLARATGIPRQNLSAMLGGSRPILVGHVAAFEVVLGLGLDYGACEWRDKP